MGEMQLAYLKRRHTELNPETDLSKTYTKDIEGHLARLLELATAGRKYDVKWGGWHHKVSITRCPSQGVRENIHHKVSEKILETH